VARLSNHEKGVILVPQRHNSVKSLRQSLKHRAHNLDIKSDLRHTLKEYVALTTTDAAKASVMLATVYKKIDKAAKRNIMHKKTAARRKARFAKLLTSKKA
jgi:small subunit ribosomal protein S20